MEYVVAWHLINGASAFLSPRRFLLAVFSSTINLQFILVFSGSLFFLDLFLAAVFSGCSRGVMNHDDFLLAIVIHVGVRESVVQIFRFMGFD